MRRHILKLRLWLVRQLIGHDWDNKVDKLRKELDEMSRPGDMANPNSDYSLRVSMHYNDLSNETEISRRMFNHYVWTGEVETPE